VRETTFEDDANSSIAVRQVISLSAAHQACAPV